jgi:UTP--glucose-1-phosphate uridylyltransferase
MMKVVITAAGKGTRLLPFTKEMPKEMMPIFSSNFSDKKSTLPLLQLIFEQLHELKFREYCFVVGREKRSIEDHFTPHESYLNELNGDYKKNMKKFYQKLDNSHLVWINQNKPIGFGDAVKRAEKFVNDDDFLVHAGDVTILSESSNPIKRLIETARNQPDAKIILLCKKVKNFKKYGVPTVRKIGDYLFEVTEVIEKPEKPKSEYGILPIYYFKKEIFSSLKKISPGKGGEYQLTDAIQKMIKEKNKVLAITLLNDEAEIDVGTVESYKDALDITFNKS